MSVSLRNLDPALDTSWLEKLEGLDERLTYYRHLSSVRAFVERHNASKVTIGCVAHAVGVSPSQLCRLFQEKLEVSFHDWLMLRRVREATRLMHARQISAAEVAHLSGFASYRSFARAFKNVVGMPPSTYRRRAQLGLSAQSRE